MAISSPPAPDPASVIPATPPPAPTASARSRTPWWMWLLIVGATTIAVIATAIVGRPPTQALGIPAERFLPADGSAWILEQGDRRFLVESAWETGVRYLLQTPGLAADELIQEVEEIVGDPSTAHFWRRTFTDLEGELPQITQIYLVSHRGISLLTATGGLQGFSYRPAIVVLPARQTPGMAWSQDGAALPRDILGYRLSTEVTDITEECITVQEGLDYIDPATSQLLSTSSATTRMCAGIGPFASTDVTDGTMSEQRITAFEGRSLDVPATPAQIAWPNANGWTAEAITLWVDDATFGRWQAYDIPDGPAVATSSGVLALVYGADAVGYRVTAGEATRHWIAHPGGTIVSAAAIGDVILLGTNRRELVAYDDDGRRAWVAAFPDAVRAEPVSDGAGGAIAVSLDGTVARLDLASGEDVWRVTPGVGAVVAPVVSDDVVYLTDRDGRVIALDLDTGDTLWSDSLVTTATFLLVDADDLLVGVSNGSVHRYTRDDGTDRHRIDTPGIPRGAAIVGERTLLIWSDGGLSVYGTHDEHLMTLPGFTSGLVSDGTTALAAHPDGTALLLGSGGKELARFETDRQALGVTYSFVPHASGVWRVGSDNTVVEFGAP